MHRIYVKTPFLIYDATANTIHPPSPTAQDGKMQEVGRFLLLLLLFAPVLAPWPALSARPHGASPARKPDGQAHRSTHHYVN